MRKVFSVFLVLLMILSLPGVSFSDTITWDGDGGDANWNTAGNWAGGVAPVGGDDLVFEGTNELNPVNNIGAGTEFSGITFSNDAATNTFTLTGNAMDLTGNITNNDDDNQIVNIDFTMNSAIEIDAHYGSMSIGSAIDNGGFLLTVECNDIHPNPAGGTVTMSDAISGTGGLTKIGNRTLTLSGTNLYTGATNVNAGTLALSGGAAIANTADVIMANTAGAALLLNASETIGSLSGGGTTGGNVYLQTFTLTTGDAGDDTYAGIISGSGGLTKAGAGTLTLSGVNTYTGATTVNAGTIKLGAAGVIADSSAVSVTGNLDMNGNSETIGSLAGAGTVTSGASGSITLTTGGANTDTTFSGAIQNGSGTVSLAKSGTGTQTLSGTNTYTGTTTVNSGTIALSGGSAIADTGAVVIADAANTGLLLNASETIGSLSGGGSTGGDINLQANTLTFGDSNNTTYSGDFSGTGGWVKNGTGTVIIGGNNTNSGGNTVNAGIVQMASNTALGAANTSEGVTSGATLDFAGYDVSTLNEVMGIAGTGVGGVGALYNSTGDASWTAHNIYLTDNALITAASGATFSFGGVNQLQLLGFDATIGGAGNTTISRAITDTVGGSTFTKEGSGTLVLSGANTYAGDTNVNAGTLELSGGSAISNSGAVIMANAAGAALKLNASETVGSLSGGGTAGGNVYLQTFTLTTGDAGDDTYAGVISGTGGVTKAGAGTLILSGVNTYTGATTVGAGTLTLSEGLAYSALDFSGDAGANVAAGKNLSYAVTNSSGGAAGTLNFLGATTTTADIGAAGIAALKDVNFNGATSCGADIFATNTNVKNGGTITSAADRTVTGNLTVEGGGTIDVGSTQWTVTNIFSSANTSTIKVGVTEATSGTINAVNQDISVNAGTGLFVNVSGHVQEAHQFTIVDGQAGGAGVGVLTSITDDSRRFYFTQVADTADLIILSHRYSTFQNDGDTPNGKTVGAQIDAIDEAGATGDMLNVIDTLDTLSDSEIGSAFDSFVPTVDAGVINTSNAAMTNFNGAALERARNVMLLAKSQDGSKTGINAGGEEMLNSIWAKGYGSYLTQGTRKGIQGYDAWNAGTALGFDHLFADCFTLGIGGGYAYGDVRSDANSGRTYINSGQAIIYGEYQDLEIPYFIDLTGSFAWNWYDGKRSVNAGPAISRTAEASYDGQQYGVYAQGGYVITVEKWEITPMVSLRWDHLRLDSYTETGAGALNLSAKTQDYDTLQSGLGGKLAYPIKYKWGVLTPEAHGKWMYDFIGDDMVVTSAFTGGGGSFDAKGCKPAQHSYNAGAKLTFDFNNDVSLIGECDTELKDEFFGIYGSVAVKYAF